MSLKSISPQAASELVNQGAVLVDIRAADEHARERIAMARHVPMDLLARGGLSLDGTLAVIFHCRSGNRTRVNASALGACTACDAYVLEGGLDAWKKAGLPVKTDTKQPLELMRQVQMAAGGLILAGALLGTLAHPAFWGLSAFVGAGLFVAGATGFCGMARLLAVMPWNRRMKRA